MEVPTNSSNGFRIQTLVTILIVTGLVRDQEEGPVTPNTSDVKKELTHLLYWSYRMVWMLDSFCQDQDQVMKVNWMFKDQLLEDDVTGGLEGKSYVTRNYAKLLPGFTFIDYFEKDHHQ